MLSLGFHNGGAERWLALGVGFGIVCAILPPLRRVVLMPLQRIPSAIFRTAGMTRLADFWWMP